MTDDIRLQVADETLKEKFLTTNGRINRLTFLKRSIALVMMNFVAVFFTMFLIMFGTMSTDLPQWANIIILGVMGLLLIPDYCINVKRLHDLGKDSTLAKIFLGVNIISLTHNMAFVATETLSPLAFISTALILGFFGYLLFTKGNDCAEEYDN